MNSKILITAVVIILGFGAFMLLSNKNNKTVLTTLPSPSAAATATPETTTSASPSAKIEEAKVTVTANGFEPQTLKIKAGTKVTWTNKSGTTANVSSDNHPTHLLYPFLNLGSFSDGSSVSVTFEKSGTFTYHNHLNPSQRGTVIVE